MKRLVEWCAEEVILILVIIMLSVSGFIIWAEESDLIGSRCVKNTTITEIVSVNYRTIEIMTLDGLLNLNQPTVKKGDKICIKWEKFNILLGGEV